MKNKIMEIKRRAPKAGYDNPKKQEYRHNVWRHLSKSSAAILKSNPNSKVLLMPSKEGFEIDVCLSYGIKPEQIIAIDENPALLAHAKWKHKIPKENRFGVKVSKIGEKIKNNGWCLAAANLDFCNNFSKELIDESRIFFKNTPLCNGFSFAVTLMKGREIKALLEMIMASESVYKVNNQRLQAWLQIVNHGYKGIDTIFEGDYFDTSPMSYGIFKTSNSFSLDFTHERADALVEEVFNIKYSHTNLELPENEKRVRYFIEYLNNKESIVWNIEDEDENGYNRNYELAIEELMWKYNIPNNIWGGDTFGLPLNHSEKEYLIKEFKM